MPGNIAGKLLIDYFSNNERPDTDVIKHKTKIKEYHLHKDQPEKLQFEIFSLNDYLNKNVGRADKAHIHSFYQIIGLPRGREGIL